MGIHEYYGRYHHLLYLWLTYPATGHLVISYLIWPEELTADSMLSVVIHILFGVY